MTHSLRLAPGGRALLYLAAVWLLALLLPPAVRAQAPAITSFTPTRGPVGTSVTITGTGFTGTTAVRFSNTNALGFVVNSPTQITVAVPAGATAGPIGVTTPGGLGVSAIPFDPTTYLMSQAGNLITCSGILYDSGGPSGSYQNSESYTKTLTPGTPGNSIRLVFSQFNTELNSDFLTIYDGPGASSAILFGPGSGTTSPGTITATNTTGQLTLRFTSTSLTVAAGFAAAISCVPKPTISSFTPTSSGAGTFVTITGTNFTGATAVRFNTTTTQNFVVDSPTQITVLVPTGTSIGLIQVTTPAGTAVSTATFDPTTYLISDPGGVTTCSGTIYDSGGPRSAYQNGDNYTKTFSPATANSKVRLAFDMLAVEPCCDGLAIYDGPSTASPLIGTFISDPGTITATNATGQLTLRFFSSITPGGKSLWGGFAAIISCVPAPTITSFTPTSGGVGTSVIITGTNFTETTAVRFNTANAPGYVVNSPTQITVTVPAGVTTGVIQVTTPGGTAISSSSFAVPAPTITGFTPTSGPAGTSVIIAGTNFTGVTAVRFNTVNAPGFVVNSPTQITAAVPVGATTGLVRVVTPSGTAVSSVVFTVPAPTISSFTPTSGGASTVVTITGTNFAGITAVRFNTVNAPSFVVNSLTQITVAVPAGATTGPIRVTNASGTAVSATAFDPTAFLMNEPGDVTTCAGTLYDSGGPSGGYQNSETYTKTISPGTLNSSIRLTFSQFDTEPTFDLLTIYDGPDTNSPVVFGSGSGTTSPGTVTATNATGQLTLQFHSDVTQVAAGFAAAITCVPAPTVTSFTPTSGPAGTSVVITGTGFTGATAVRFNNLNAPGFVVNSPIQITVLVPPGNTTGPIRVYTPTGIAVSASSFTTPNPTITGFTPTSGLAGTSVTITGTNLALVTGVRFGTGGLTTDFIAQSATSLTVAVPVTALTGQLTLTNPGAAVRSTASFSYRTRLNLMAMLSPAGPLDVCAPRTLTASAISPAFAPGTSFDDFVTCLAVQADGRVLAGGDFTSYNGVAGFNRLARLNPDGSPDASFNTGLGFNNTVQCVAVQTAGKVLVGGRFTSYNGATANRLVRLNSDGSLDTGFATGTGFNGEIFSVTTQADGRVLVGGGFSRYNGAPSNGLVRLNPDGSLDASFATGTGFNEAVYSVAVQADGRVLVGGNFSGYNGTTGLNRLARLHSDGSLDTGFSTGTGFDNIVRSLAVQADGQVLAGGNFIGYDGTTTNRLARLNPDGSLDTGFATGTGFNDVVHSIALQADGQVVVGGYFNSYNGATGVNCAVRLLANGSRDASFNTGTGFNAVVRSVALQADGQVLAGGYFNGFNGTTGLNRLVRLNPDGSRNTIPVTINGATFSFSPGGSPASSLATSTAGTYSVVASFNGETSAASNVVTLTPCPLPTITSFTPASGVIGTSVTITGTGLAGASAVLVNGTAGTITANTATSLTFAVATGSTTGLVSVTTGGGTATSISPFTVVPLPGISSFTPTSGPAGTRVTITGTDLDLVRSVRFGTGSQGLFTAQSATSLTVVVPVNAATGPLTLSGALGGGVSSAGNFTYTPRPAGLLATLSPAGPLDVCAPRTLTASAASPVFVTDTGFNNYVSHTALQPDGKLLVVGNFTSYNGTTANRLVRLNPDGSLDTGFAIGAGFNDAAFGVAVQTNGRILVSGNFTSYNGTTANRLVRLNADGSLDTGFAIGTGLNGMARTVVVQADGQLLVGGQFTSYNGILAGGLVRLNPNGSLDADFATGTGFDNTVYSVEVQADGRILAGGTFVRHNGTVALRLARLNADGSRDASFVMGTGLNAAVINAALQPDGKLLVGGPFTSYNTTTANRLVRLNADGSRDTSFVMGTGFNNSVSYVAVLPDGQLLVGGQFTSYNGTAANRLVRLNPNGSLDMGFSTGTGFDNTVSNVTIQADGQVLTGGEFTSFNGTANQSRLVRLNADGSRNVAPLSVSGATFNFAPGSGIADFLTTSVAGSYTATASLNGEISAASNAVTLTSCPSTPLPVQLVSFSATAQGPAAVRLVWTTASEQNSAYFEVERSQDGVSFTHLGTLTAAGTTATPHTYALLDASLPAGASQLYYRLRQVDLDGTFTYSPVRVVTLGAASTEGLAVFPNPTHGGAATLLGARASTVVTVFDALGRLVATATADAAGTATLALPAGLPAGVYVVRAGQQALRLVVAQ